MKVNAKELFLTPIEKLTFSVVDIETTGMHHAYCKIIDIGIVKVKNGKIIAEWETLINPKQTIPFWITFYTNLRQKNVKNKLPFENHAKKIHNLIKSSIFVAHNVGFDYPFLQSELDRCKIAFNNPKLCTVKLGRHLLPNLPSANLDTISDYFDISIKNRHRALPDAQATAMILIEFIKMAKEKYSIKTYYDLERLQYGKTKLTSFLPNLFHD